MPRPKPRLTVRERLEEIAREIGVLLMTFAALDAGSSVDFWRALRVALLFESIGILLIVGSLLSERRR